MCNWYTAPSDTDTSSDTGHYQNTSDLYLLYVMYLVTIIVEPGVGMQNNDKQIWW